MYHATHRQNVAHSRSPVDYADILDNNWFYKNLCERVAPIRNFHDNPNDCWASQNAI